MPTPGSPAVRRRRLAAELRRLRSDAKKTAEDVAKLLGWSKAKVSRYELAQSGLKPVDVERLLDLYGIQGRHREQLLALAEDATGKGWWEPYADILTEGHLAYIGLEAEATSILEWQVNTIPGLLQTEQYARRILSAYDEVAPVSPRTIERLLETRLIRQRFLTRDDPLEHVALIDESVLLRQRGGRLVMDAQLRRLAELSELPNVTIRVLPLQRDHGLAVDSFSILQFSEIREAALQDVVILEHLRGEQQVDVDSETHAFRIAFNHLAAECLSAAESRQLIVATAERLWAS